MGAVSDRLQLFKSQPAERRFDAVTRSSLDEVKSALEREAARRRGVSRVGVQRPGRDMSSRAVRARERSARRYRGLGAASATALTRQHFDASIRGVSEVPDLSDVVAFRGPNVAVLKPRPGRAGTELLVSPAPLGAETDGGTLKPVDLTLQREGEAWVPVNASVESKLPADADGSIDAAAGVRFSLADADGASGAKLGESAVFYANAWTDADVSLVPAPGGVETFFTLRSQDAPEALGLRFGAQDVVAQHGKGVRVSRAGRVVGEVMPPSAVDAQGTPVPVSLAVQDGQVVVRAPHRGLGFAYPILVDPLVETLENPPRNIRFLDDYLDPDSELGSISRDAWYVMGGSETFPALPHATGEFGRGLYLERAAESNADTAMWAFVLPSRMNVTQVDFGPYASNYSGDDPAEDPVAMVIGGPGHDTVVLDDTDGDDKFLEVPTDAGAGPTQILAFGLMGAPEDGTYAEAHTAYLGGAVMHVTVNDPPVFPEAPPGDASPGEVFWTNYAGTLGGSFTAESAGAGVQRMELVATDDTTGQNTVVGGYEDPCNGSLAAPCPTSLQHDMSIDFGLLDEGSYTLHLAAYDPFDTKSEDVYTHIGIDRTPPDPPEVETNVVDDGDYPTLEVTVPQEDPGSSVVSSGVSGVKVTDDNALGGNFFSVTSCLTDDCGDPTLVPLHDDEELEHHITARVQDLAGNIATYETTTKVVSFATEGED